MSQPPQRPQRPARQAEALNSHIKKITDNSEAHIQELAEHIEAMKRHHEKNTRAQLDLEAMSSEHALDLQNLNRFGEHIELRVVALEEALDKRTKKIYQDIKQNNGKIADIMDIHKRALEAVSKQQKADTEDLEELTFTLASKAGDVAILKNKAKEADERLTTMGDAVLSLRPIVENLMETEKAMKASIEEHKATTKLNEEILGAAISMI